MAASPGQRLLGAAARRASVALDRVASRAAAPTDTRFIPPRRSQDAGWTVATGGPVMGRAARAASDRVTDPLRTYGGTDEASTWVYACVTKRAQSLSGYPWSLTNPTTGLPLSRKPRGSDPQEFEQLLGEPWPRATYADFVELLLTDLDLCGDAFWLLDEQNALTQPKYMRRFQPGSIKIAVDDRDEEVGYVLTLKNGLRVPYSLEEVVHFKYPNPLNEHYGMGIVEALIRAVDADLSQSAHVTAFFDQGAHLSGVLTVPETLGQDEFERLKQQYEEEFARSNNSFRVLIAEQATNYQPIASTPAGLGVVDLRNLTKDEVLSGFGTPEFILGGRAQGGVYTMEEAQAIFYQAMVPVASKISLTTSGQIASRFGVGFTIHPKQSDTATAKAERSRKLVGIGATIDDMREEAGLIRLNLKGVTDVPMIPSGLVPATGPQLGPGGQPQAQPNDGGQPSGGPDSDRPEQGGGRDGEDGNPSPGDARTARVPNIAGLLPGGDLELDPLTDLRDLLEPPRPEPLPEDPFTAEPAPLTARVAQQRERTLAEMTVRARTGLVPFFLAQRDRVIERLSDFGPARGGNLRAKPKRPKRELDGPALWDFGAEREEALSVLFPVVEQTASRAWNDVMATEGRADPPPHLAGDQYGPDWRRALSDVMGRAADDLSENVRERLYEEVAEGLRRNYSVAQIANGFGTERYGGVLGVYDHAVSRVAEAKASEVAQAAYDAAHAVAAEHLSPSAVGAER